MLDEEWSMFLQEPNKVHGHEPLKASVDASATTADATATTSTTVATRSCVGSPLTISTKTKISYLNKDIPISELFWELKLIPYSSCNEGILKKQMKFNSHTLEEFKLLQQQIDTERKKGFRTQEDVITPNSVAYMKRYKDVRKLSVGFCTKDFGNKHRVKSAFYNCFVIILRVNIHGVFKEYHVKVFNTGKIEIPGIKEDYEYDKLMISLVRVLGEYDAAIGISDQPSDTILINSNFKTGYYINRDHLYDILMKDYKIQCVYDPCSYPGIQCKFFYYKDRPREAQTGVQDYDDIKGKGYGYKKKKDIPAQQVIPTKLQNRRECKYMEISIMIFRTGSILIVGMCSEEILNDVYFFIRQLMEKEYHRIKQSNQEIEPFVSKKKKNKKQYVVVETA
jgi:hypothetical protein